jgi:hypothetical protein
MGICPVTVPTLSAMGQPGFSTIPFRLNNGAKLGLFWTDTGAPVLMTDFYNRAGFEIPGTSFLSLELFFSFGKNVSLIMNYEQQLFTRAVAELPKKLQNRYKTDWALNISAHQSERNLND